MKLETVPISCIKVTDRARTDFGDIDALAGSISRIGLLHPPVVDSGYNLICGERRYRACTLLGWNEIPVLVHTKGSTQLHKEKELGENIHRKQMTWQEECQLVKEVHECMLERAKGTPVKWTITNTAELLSISHSSAVAYLNVAKVIEKDPSGQVATASGIAQAITRARLNKQVEEARVLNSMTAPYKEKEDTAIVYNGDCTSILPALSQKVDLVIADPPFGVNLNSSVALASWSDTGEVYGEFSDTPEAALELYSRCIPLLYNSMNNGACMFWFFSFTLYSEVLAILKNTFQRVSPNPFMWIKPGGGFNPSPYTIPTLNYEPFFFCRKMEGGHKKDCFTKEIRLADSIPVLDKDHPAAKPELLYANLILACTLEGQTVLDPFCGSGNSGVQAKSYGRRYIGIEKDERYYQLARSKVDKASNKYDISQYIGGDKQ